MERSEAQEPVKRGAQQGAEASSKRARHETALVEAKQAPSALIKRQEQNARTSQLAAPNMLLTGHSGAIYTMAFDPSGNHLASGSNDKSILLWDVYGECSNYNILQGHKNAVLEIHWSTNNRIISASADKTVAVWDPNRGRRLSRLTEHEGIVNSCAVARDAPELFASGSDDCSVLLWDTRAKRSQLMMSHEYQVTSVCMAHDGLSIYSGGIDNVIRKFDLRKEGAEVLALQGHADTITGLAMHPEGTHILSNSMDQTMRAWDIRSFVTSEQHRCEKVLQGGRHGAEKILLRCAWSPTGDKVTCGSSDRVVHVWDYASGSMLYHLPGHHGSVNEVIFHPTEPILASCGSDKQIFLGEIAP